MIEDGQMGRWAGGRMGRRYDGVTVDRKNTVLPSGRVTDWGGTVGSGGSAVWYRLGWC